MSGVQTDWLQAVVPLGLRADGDQWLPRGLGVLLIQDTVLWLAIPRSLLASAAGHPMLALIDDGGAGATVDVTTGRSGTATDWILDPDDDLAVSIFPHSPTFRVKAFTPSACLPFKLVQPMLQVTAVNCPYGSGEPGFAEPRPILLPGTISRVEPERRSFYTDARMLPSNLGAPIVTSIPAEAGGGVALAGIAVGAMTVPEPAGSPRPPLVLTTCLASAAIVALLQSDATRAQRELASSLRDASGA